MRELGLWKFTGLRARRGDEVRIAAEGSHATAIVELLAGVLEATARSHKVVGQERRAACGSPLLDGVSETAKKVGEVHVAVRESDLAKTLVDVSDWLVRLSKNNPTEKE